MLDIQLLRNNLELVRESLSARGAEFDGDLFVQLEAERKQLQIKTEELQSSRNRFSKDIGKIKKEGGDSTELMKKMGVVGRDLDDVKKRLISVLDRLKDMLMELPNLPHDTVPVGVGEADNVEVRKVGVPRDIDFEPKDHVDIGENLSMLNFDIATKITGSRFTFMKGKLAKLHRSIANFMLDIHTKEHGYSEVYVPYLVNSASMVGTGQLPKFEEDLFAVQGADGERFYTIPTAEVPVTNIVRDEILDSKSLPMKFVCHSPCFRSEAGSYGKDTRGMIRQHQFDKVELVQIVEPQDSYSTLEELTGHAEKILQLLKLPYRVVVLCTRDMGFSAAKTFDIEVWLPGQSAYREISSCSNFEEFQARRMKARYRKGNGKPELVHTLNGSGLAVGRTLIAVLENYQQKDGTVVVPDGLVPYMDGETYIEPADL